MKIIKIISRSRRDFTAAIQCENCCNNELLESGYDDDNYHRNVLPNMKCSACQESTISAGYDILPWMTKYAPNEII